MKKLTTYTLLFSLLMFSCNKLPKVEEPTPTPAPNPTPTFIGSDGVMVAISTLTYQTTPIGDMAVDVDVATAIFSDPSNNSYYSVGTVGVNSNNLEIADNKVYLSVSGTSANIDLGFSSSNYNTWTVGGNSAMPAFTHTTGRGMPSEIKFSAEFEKIKTANPHTVSIVSAPAHTDSILYVLGTNDKTVVKTVSSSTTSVTFTSAEMSGLSGTGIMQVAAYNYENSVEGGKTIYFVNEVVISDVVKFE